MYEEEEDNPYVSFSGNPKPKTRKNIFLLTAIVVILLVIIIIVVSVTESTKSSSFKQNGFCVPGQKCFPNKKALNSFNSSINGRLYAERPLASVCYRGDPSFNAEQCEEYNMNASSSRYRYEHFPSYQFVTWEYCGLSNCSARSITDIGTCDQGSIPSYSVHAETSNDVQLFVQFATRFNLRIVVKNTGHDLLGRSSGKDGFAVWTHKMKNIEVMDTFQPEGCATNYEKAISVGAGVQWIEAYTAVHQHGRVVVGGMAASVGAAGGWVQGGGHSLLSPAYGLGADNLIEVEIVTADGKITKASECSNPELFWAVRGGGGGTWGVVTQVTYQTRPETQIYSASVSFSMDINNITFLDMLTLWIKTAPILGDLGVGGATVLSANSLGAMLTLPASEANWTDFESALSPVSMWLEEYNAGSVVYTNYTSWYDYYLELNPPQDSQAGGAGGSISSRIIPRQYFENNPERMAEITYQALKTTPWAIIGHAAPVKLRKKPIRTSVNPIWYDSLWHVLADDIFIQQYRIMAPDAAVYFGESATHEPNYTQGYWGTNYDELKKVKAKWDPEGHFQVWHGVGTTYQESEWNCYDSE